MPSPERRCRGCGCTEKNACTLVHRQTDEEMPCWWEVVKKPYVCHGCMPKPRRIADRVLGPALPARACASSACKKLFTPARGVHGARPKHCSPECARALQRERKLASARAAGVGIVVDASCACGRLFHFRKPLERHRAKCRFVRDQRELFPAAAPPVDVGGRSHERKDGGR